MSPLPSVLVTLTSPDWPIPAADPELLDAILEPRLALFWGAHTTARTLLAAATITAANTIVRETLRVQETAD